jgi:hypothetical protein
VTGIVCLPERERNVAITLRMMRPVRNYAAFSLAARASRSFQASHEHRGREQVRHCRAADTVAQQTVNAVT